MGRGKNEKVGQTVQAVKRRFKPKPFKREQGTLEYSFPVTSSKGLETTFQFYHNAKDGAKEAWLLEVLEVHADDGQAGYLKISYIPRENIELYFPTPLHLAVRDGGKYYAIRDLLDKGAKKWTHGDYVKALAATDGWLPGGQEKELKETREAMGDEEIKGAWQERFKKLCEEEQGRYDKFIKHHLDNPFVDYIRVYQDNEQYNWPSNEGCAPRSYQRQGLATAMYENGALWMHSRGLRLYASSIQSGDAQGVWGQLEERGLVKEENGRRFLDVETLLNQKPELQETLNRFSPVAVAA